MLTMIRAICIFSTAYLCAANTTWSTEFNDYPNIIKSIEAEKDIVIESRTGDIANYYIKENDSLDITYKKLLILCDYFIKSKERAKAYEMYLNNSKLAFELFPDCGAIAARYFWISWYKDANVPALKEMKIIIPYLYEANLYNAIPVTMSNIFKSYIDNIDSGMVVHKDLFFRYFSANNEEELKANIVLLYYLWTSQIHPATKQDVQNKIKVATDFLKNKDESKKAHILWNNLVANVYTQREITLSQEIAEFNKKRELEQNAPVNEEHNKKILLAQQEALSSLLIELHNIETINTATKIRVYMVRLMSFKTILEKSDNLPNFEALRQVYKGTNNAELVNLYYRFFVRNEDVDVLSAIDKMDAKNDDTRLLYLKVWIVMKQRKNLIEAQKIIGRIIELSPDDELAYHLKVNIDFMIKNTR